LSEILANNPVYGHDSAVVAQPAMMTFPYAKASYLATKVEEETRVVLENENGTGNIAVWGDHPYRAKAYCSGCL